MLSKQLYYGERGTYTYLMDELWIELVLFLIAHMIRISSLLKYLEQGSSIEVGLQ